MKHTEPEQPESAAPLVVRLPDGRRAPLVVGPAAWKNLTGDKRDERSIREDCETGRLPCLPRRGGSGSHHRIAVARALEQLGVPFEITSVRVP